VEWGPRRAVRGPHSLVQAIEQGRSRSDVRTVAGEFVHSPDDLPESSFDPELAEAGLENDDALLDLFAEGLDEVHPRLSRTLGDEWARGDEVG